DEKLLRIKHARVIHRAFAVLKFRQLHCAGGGPHTPGEGGHLALRAQVGRDGVFDFTLRLHDGAFVIANERLETGILHANIILDASIVKDRPSKARSAKVFQTSVLKKILKISGRHADRAKQGKTGEEIRLGYADLGALRGNL